MHMHMHMHTIHTHTERSLPYNKKRNSPINSHCLLLNVFEVGPITQACRQRNIIIIITLLNNLMTKMPCHPK